MWGRCSKELDRRTNQKLQSSIKLWSVEGNIKGLLYAKHVIRTGEMEVTL